MSIYKKNLDVLVRDIKKLDEKLRELLQPHKGAAFLVFHPAWGYFVQDYGLRQLAVKMEGKEPKPTELAQLIRLTGKRSSSSLFPP